MRFIIASNNKKKLTELKTILSGFGALVISQSEAGLDFETEENGTTFEENALIKARAACKALKEPSIADDSGLVVDALGGQPGVYSARYGGISCRTDEDRVSLLLKNMQGKTDRRARFISCIACVFPNGDVLTARGECEGMITHEPRGEGGFGYDPVFELTEKKMTMAELSAEEKNTVSHRGAALRNFEEKLRKYYADK
ncbi:MAG: XTP/dITP diphosphatase [Clostridia bacterium]|nr:XTP/dITP diphosphatase [Clostridia bacterium]